MSPYTYSYWVYFKPIYPLGADTTYSSDLYGQHTLDALEAHDPATPMFLYLPWQVRVVVVVVVVVMGVVVVMVVVMVVVRW